MGASWLFNDTTTCRQAPPPGLVLLWTAIVEAHGGVATSHTMARLSAGNRAFATNVNTKTQATWLMLKKQKKLEANEEQPDKRNMKLRFEEQVRAGAVSCQCPVKERAYQRA
jgi:hypothetical protein